MSEIGTQVASSSTAAADKATPSAKHGVGDAVRPEASTNDHRVSPPRKTSQSRHDSDSDQQSPRKSNQQQSPQRKYSNRQSPQSHQQQPQYPTYQQRQQFNPQFQPSWRKLSDSRQQCPPTFRVFQQPPDQISFGAWNQSHRGHRRGSSRSVSFQLNHDQSQQQNAVRKTSYHRMRNDSDGGNPQQQGNAVGIDRHRQLSGAKNRNKIDASGLTPISGRNNKGSFASPRWSSLSEGMENGDYDYCSDEFEMEEPFSDSDEDETPEEREARRKRQAKPQLLLPMPRRRIRTLSGMIPAVGYAPVWGGPTMCLNCLEFFDLPKQTTEYVQHLLEKHKIVITDIELIVDLKRYVEYWRHRFGQQPIEKMFPLVTPAEGDPLLGKVDNFYLISEKVPEDRQIRERLALRRLEEVLSCQQREREDRTFSRQCLFCRYRTKGNRAKLVHHLYTIHHLNLGSPDNLVFVSEYLDVLEGKLKRNECIYCEKTFPDHPTLSEHMRKKQHREVNPKNNYYDRFYVINYLELGKKWLEVLAEDFEDNTPTFLDSDEEEEEESWNEWQEDADVDNEMTAVCLFCDEAFHEAISLLEHMKGTHHYDLKKVFADGHFGFYDRVKFINYIRKLSHECVCFVCGTDDLHSWPALRKHLANPEHLAVPIDKVKWDKDEYLIPTYDNDSLLCLLENILDLDEEDFATYVRLETSGDAVRETITESNEDEEKENEEPPRKIDAGNKSVAKESEQKKDKVEKGEWLRHEQQLGTCVSGTIVVIPEDFPVLESSPLNDPELRKQLQ